MTAPVANPQFTAFSMTVELDLLTVLPWQLAQCSALSAASTKGTLKEEWVSLLGSAMILEAVSWNTPNLCSVWFQPHPQCLQGQLWAFGEWWLWNLSVQSIAAMACPRGWIHWHPLEQLCSLRKLCPPDSHGHDLSNEVWISVCDVGASSRSCSIYCTLFKM